MICPVCDHEVRLLIEDRGFEILKSCPKCGVLIEKAVIINRYKEVP